MNQISELALKSSNFEPGTDSGGGAFAFQPSHPSKKYDLSLYDRIYLIAFGKAASAMAGALLEILGDRIADGIVVVLPGQTVRFHGLRVFEAPHPLPDERSAEAARAILALARKAGENDLVIVLISGGGSAQVCLPLSPASLEDKKRLTLEMMSRGADIRELNVVRKHLSAFKGGRLAEAAYPAELVSLAISDVIGDDLEIIASGPAYWDSSTFEDAFDILRKYGIWEGAVDGVRRTIEAGRKKLVPETLKKGAAAFDRMTSFIIGNNRMALTAAANKAEELGFRSFLLTATDYGEARMSARRYVSLVLSFALSRKRPRVPLCLLAGGELTVTVTGKGMGGRNQEFVLAALSELERQTAALEHGHPEMRFGFAEDGRVRNLDWLIASLGTDGTDGNTDAAGAWISATNLKVARSLGLAPETFLADNNSYHFFEKAGGLIHTGPTGTNVMDLRIFLLS
jgi:glycerate 2-kinase